MSSNTEPSPDEIRLRLAEISDELAGLAPGDFAAKYQLQLERDQLRDLARVAVDRDADRSTEELSAELAARQAALTALESSSTHAGSMSAAGGAGSGAYEGPADGLRLRALQEESSGLAALRQRVARLETLLADRRSG